ncbi:MAG: glycosyltransferase [Rickettsiales bacterium]|nr:glycosyltransferase [Rickettsiales bacterium]
MIRDVQACLDSLLNQTLQDIEIIVIDDKSHDNTLAEKSRLILVFPPIQPLRSHTNWNYSISLYDKN